MREYGEAQRQMAIEIADRYGGDITPRVLEDIRAALGAPNLPRQTVTRWKRNFRPSLVPNLIEKLVGHTPSAFPTGTPDVPDPLTPANITAKTHEALDDMFESAARLYLNHARQEAVVKATDGTKAMTAAAIAVDKMRLLRGLPTVIVEALPVLRRLGELFEADGVEASEVFGAMLQQYEAERATIGAANE
jgi:hypothetical protein